MMIKDGLVMLPVYLILSGVQLLAWPWLYRFGKNLIDYGWAGGRMLLILVVALVIWFGGHLKLPLNTDWGITVVFVTMALLTWKFQKREIRPAFKALGRVGHFVIAEEVLLGLGFFGYAWVRGFQPDILGLEKFMDYGFIKSYLSTPILPANDVWWAGGTINYYSFGHFVTGVLIRVWGVAPSLGYNLMLAFILASVLTISFSVIINLFAEREISDGRKMFGGAIGALLVTLGGNSHTLWYLLVNRNLNGYWYADATRFIQNTIHEFPGYSFVVSDLHGHVLSLPLILIFILFLVAWFKGRNRLTEVGLGVLLGVMLMTNTWDGAIYGLLLVILLSLIVLAGQLRIRQIGSTLMIVITSAVITAMPWLIGFKSISNGLAAVEKRSSLWQLIALWAVHGGVTITVVAAAVKKKNLMILAMGLAALALILLPEFIYVRDIYPNHPRANTMFKLTYQSFVMMSLLLGWLTTVCLNLKRKILGSVLTGCLLIMFGGLMLFPYLAFSSYYGDFKSYRGLDGFFFLYQRYPEEAAIIEYLVAENNGKNMIEAVGDSYTETDFVSAFSGVPTVVGWRVHEWLWRGGYEEVGRRSEEVKQFYEGKSLSEKTEIIKKYNLGWVVVTPRERQRYKIDEEAIKSLGVVVYSGKSSFLVKVN